MKRPWFRDGKENCASQCVFAEVASPCYNVFVHGFLKIAASRRTSVEGEIRLSFQRDVPGQPYIFEVDFLDGELSGSFFIGMNGLGEEEHFRIPSAFGNAPDFAKISPRTASSTKALVM